MNYIYKIDYRIKSSDDIITCIAKNDDELKLAIINLSSANQRSCVKIKERWVDIQGYYGRYQVSNFGRVKSFIGNENRVLEQCENHNGYLRVCLYDLLGNQRTHRVHRLVAQTFLPNPDDLPEVDHIQGDRKCNYSFMLRWATSEENSFRKPVAQFFKNGNFKTLFKSAIDAQRKGFLASHISECCNGKRKTHSNYIWRFV